MGIIGFLKNMFNSEDDDFIEVYTSKKNQANIKTNTYKVYHPRTVINLNQSSITSASIKQKNIKKDISNIAHSISNNFIK